VAGHSGQFTPGGLPDNCETHCVSDIGCFCTNMATAGVKGLNATSAKTHLLLQIGEEYKMT